MSVFGKLKDDLKSARIAKVVFKADTLRTLIGDIENAVSQVGAKPIEEIVQSKLKSFSQNSSDFVTKLKAAVVVDEQLIIDKLREIEIYESYRIKAVLADIAVIEASIIAKFAVITAKDRGAIMSHVKAEFAGLFDGKAVSDLVTRLMGLTK
jgi:uncharacterized protein YqeY